MSKNNKEKVYDNYSIRPKDLKIGMSVIVINDKQNGFCDYMEGKITSIGKVQFKVAIGDDNYSFNKIVKYKNASAVTIINQ